LVGRRIAVKVRVGSSFSVPCYDHLYHSMQVIEADLPPDVALYKLIFEDLLVGAADNLVLQRSFLLPDLRSGRFPLAAEHPHP